MKKLLLLITTAVIGTISIHAQVNASPAAYEKAKSGITPYSLQFYFPSTLYKDSISLYQALPALAEHVSAVYNDLIKEKDEAAKFNYYDSSFHFQIVKQDYPKAVALIDSARKFNEWDSGNNAMSIEFESYARAKSKVQNNTTSFPQVYLKTLEDLYNHLQTNREKIFTDYFLDAANIKSAAEGFHKIVESLGNKNTDSISFKDAEALLYRYNTYIVYSTIIPIARTYLDGTPLRVMYPLIRNPSALVVPVSDVDEFPDKNMQYKLIMEVTSGIKDKKDSTAINSINGSFSEVARKLNLHLAAGVPKKNISIVVIAHGPVLYSLLNNDSYRKKYHTDNPNITIIKDLQNAGVKFIACGQAMFGFNVKKEEMLPNIKVALSAQTVLSTYQLKNYVYYDLSERN